MFEMKSGLKYEIRKVRLSDAERMLVYLDTVAGESDNLTFGPGEMAITLEKEQAFLESLEKADNQVMFVAVHENKIIAVISYVGGSRARTQHIGEFGISVLKKYWHQGVGKKMMGTLIDWAKASQYCEKMNLKVREDNLNAIYLYKQIGFKEEGLLLKDMKINGEYVNCLLMGMDIK